VPQDKPLGLGLIGCGGFGLFCAEAFGAMSEVRLIAAARARKKPAREKCLSLGFRICDDYSEVIADDEIDIIHVATPPSHHYDPVMQGLRAGKHVLCEKPLTLRPEQGQEMVEAARQRERFLVTNYVMRYSPITEVVKRIIESGVLGRVLWGSVTNCGSDSGLREDHWFWDKGVSGGIFVEHAVHFFDLYEYWVGPGEVISAHAETREGTDREDRVLCTVRHDDTVLVSHYHAFDQIATMDRTAHRIVCELGDIHVEGWIPQKLTVDAAVNEQTTERLKGCCPDYHLEIVEEYQPHPRKILGRGKLHEVTRRAHLHYAPFEDKQALYADCVRSLLREQISWVRDPAHPRRVTEKNGLVSLRCGQTAAKLALDGQQTHKRKTNER